MSGERASGDASVVLAIDVGGTSFKGALIDTAGRARHAEDTPTLGLTGEPLFARLLALVDRLLAHAAGSGVCPVALGVIAPGTNEQTGRVMFASNLGWRDFPLRDRLAAHCGLPVGTGHDVRAAGLAESLLGAARDHANAMMVMIGTGIAAALIVNGQVVAGSASMGGEFGHVPVFPGGEACPCGQYGCLEAYASGASIARRYRAGGGTGALSAATIAARTADDPVAARVWDEAVQALAIGLVSATMLLDPALFVLGGGLAASGPLLLEPLAAALSRRLAWRSAPPIVCSTLGQMGALLGAATLGLAAVGRGGEVARWDAVALQQSNRTVPT